MILLLACATPDWTHEQALRPALDRVDTDHDGTISAAEYERVAFNAPTFAVADVDGSGGIDVGELEVLLETQNPRAFHASARVPLPNFGAPPGASTVKVEEHGYAWLVLSLLREEILAADPAAVVPDTAQVLAADAGGLDGPAARALLVQLERSAQTAGLAFPPSLAVTTGP